MTLTNYWYIIIWMFGIGICGLFFPKQKEESGIQYYKRWGIFSAIIVVVPLIIWATFRTSEWGDTGAYRTLFYQVPSSISDIPLYLKTVTKDKGFTALTIFLKSIWGKTSVFYFFVVACVQLISLALVYRKYSCDYWFSIFVFVATTDYMSWCHNGIRQFLAVTIIFAASSWIFEKKYLCLVLLILIVSTIHGSALLMIPIVFIIQGKAANKKTLLCIVAALVALAFVDQFTNILDTLLSDTQYTNVVSDWQSGNDDGTNPIRVLVYAIPTVLGVLGYKYVKNEDNNIINVCVNASIVSTALSILSMGTSGIFIGRLPIYCSLYSNGILLPWEIDNMFTKESARIVKIIAVLMYSLFFYYQMHFTWGLV